MLVVPTNAARARLVTVHGSPPTASTSSRTAPWRTSARRTRPARCPPVLTWGLIGPGKGLEHGVEAMWHLRHLDPAPVYVIAGDTHPKVKARDGERYRDGLMKQAADLGVSDRVRLRGLATSTPAALRALVARRRRHPPALRVARADLLGRAGGGRVRRQARRGHRVPPRGRTAVERLRHRGAARGPRGDRARDSAGCSPTTPSRRRCARRRAARPSGSPGPRWATGTWSCSTASSRSARPRDGVGPVARASGADDGRHGDLRARDRGRARAARTGGARTTTAARSPSSAARGRPGGAAPRHALPRVPRARA